jgi:tRNA (guanine37-N1)-methyltransferase
LCGHYEGIDERVKIILSPEEISIGDYVLTGGELAALVLIDSAVRLIPGVVGDSASIEEESFNGILEYPHYTRPFEFRGVQVPQVLLSGDHENIRRWRRRQALLNTARKRPDLLSGAILTEEEREIVEEIKEEESL